MILDPHNLPPDFGSRPTPSQAVQLITAQLPGREPLPRLLNEHTGKGSRITAAAYDAATDTLTITTHKGVFSIHASNWEIIHPSLVPDVLYLHPVYGTAKYTVNLY